MSTRIGVYVCHCGSNIAGKLDVEKVKDFAAGLEDVVVAKEYKFMCSEPGQELIKKDIKEQKLDRVVVAACSPRMHEPTFRGACASAGLNPYLMDMANIREHCSWVTENYEQATGKAMSVVAGSVGRVRFLEELQEGEVEANPDVRVLGGGIAGIQTALDLADSGHKVYLVEKEQSIGGHMAQFDKTFPTLDCSACILTPKMVSVGQHPNIELLNYSELEAVDGFVGNFVARVRVKARYVDYEKCNGCGACIEKCPKKVLSTFEEGMAKRKAIYVDFPQAVPNKPVIDRENCVYFKKGTCRACEKNCEVGAIDWEQQDEIREIPVGAIVLATGYDLFDAKAINRLGLGKYDDVYTSLEFERMLNAAGPTGGDIVMKNGSTPQSIAIAHCVGSRDKNHHEYCSRICCMAGLKFAHLIKERLPECDVTNFYIDMRCFGKGYEEFYHRILDEKVKFVRGKMVEVSDQLLEEEEGPLVVQAEDTMLAKNLRMSADMVVLLPALKPRADQDAIAQLMKCSRSSDGFLLEKHPKLGPVETALDGVFIAGTVQGPKDIPDTVAQGSAAAAAAIKLLSSGTVKTEAAVVNHEEEICSGCKVCVGLCPYGAIDFDIEKKVARFNTALCKGCGTCAAACPSGAIRAQHFTSEQILGQVLRVLSL